jgi:YrbI family 3-deoxy-D-manno-octulosonate 8-phosphate phosphatase
MAAALSSSRIDEVVLATDDDDAAQIGRNLGATVFARSAESASDEAPTEAVLMEVAQAIVADVYVLLQPTSPLTSACDVDAALAVLDEGHDSVLSVVPQTRFTWAQGPSGWTPTNYSVAARPRRQETEPFLVENGAIYAFRASVLTDGRSRLGGKIGIFKMSEDTYYELDEPADWIVVDALLGVRRDLHYDRRLQRIKLVITDVDGVLTDNGMYWSSDGAELKRFSARDGKGFEILHRAGIVTALLTSESADLVSKRGQKLGCRETILGSRDKVKDADSIRRRLGVDWDEIAYIGDDLHDCDLMRRVGFSATPMDGIAEAQRSATKVLRTKGGHGAFRELADLILTAQMPSNE